MKKNNSILHFKGETYVDDRGVIRFVNDFTFDHIKRFYEVENFNQETIRAFHGHKKEGKYFYIISGSILLNVVQINNIKSPRKDAPIHRFILSAKNTEFLYIPPGYANGFKALEPNSRIIIYSTSTLKESLKDDYRYPYDYWGENIWKIKNR